MQLSTEVRRGRGNPLKLELQAVVCSPPWRWEPNLSPLQELHTLLTAEPPLQTPSLFPYKFIQDVVPSVSPLPLSLSPPSLPLRYLATTPEARGQLGRGKKGMPFVGNSKNTLQEACLP